MKLSFLGVVSVCLTMLACSVEQPELAGVYRAEYPFGSDVLALRSDGTFTQSATATIAGVKRTAQSSGTWWIEKAHGRAVDRLNIQGLMRVENGFGQPDPNFGSIWPGAGVVPFGRRFGVGRLYLGGGNGFPHWRVDESASAQTKRQ